MAIAAADVEHRYSGGASNTNPSLALGGAMSTVAGGTIDDNIAQDLFDDVTGTEAGTGRTEYRGFFVKNNHGSLTLAEARAFITSNTTSADDTLAIALADEGVTTAIETIANETTAPVGPIFSAPVDYATGLQLNGTTGLIAGAYKGLWIRRVVNVGAATISNNTATLRIQGDSPP